ncbi:MAG: hypothetical protein AAGI38_21435 [Bacteroidota bacterium]
MSRILILAVLGIAIVAGILWSISSPNTDEYVTTARLDRIQYVQELHLVTYFYEELITLGVPSPVADAKTIVDTVKQETVSTEEALVKYQSHVALLKTKLEEAKKSESKLKEVWDKVKPGFIRRLFGGKQAKMDSPEYQAFEVARHKRQNLQKELKTAEKALKNQQNLAKDKQRELKRAERELERKSKRNNANVGPDAHTLLSAADLVIIAPVEVDGYVDMSHTYFRLVRDQREERWEDDSINLKVLKQDVEEKLASDAFKSDTVQDSVQNRTGSPAARLYDSLLLEQKMIAQQLDSLRKQVYANPDPKDTLEILVTPARIGPVHVKLEASEEYDLSRRFSLNFSQKGSYIEVFEELKEALAMTKEEVRTKALARGLLQETEKVATDYLRKFMQGFPAFQQYALKVRFLPQVEIERIKRQDLELGQVLQP